MCRFVDGYFAQQGAVNPAGVSAGLLKALEECETEGVSPNTDPGVSLIIHQLAFLSKAYTFDYFHIESFGFSTPLRPLIEAYRKAVIDAFNEGKGTDYIREHSVVRALIFALYLSSYASAYDKNNSVYREHMRMCEEAYNNSKGGNRG